MNKLLLIHHQKSFLIAGLAVIAIGSAGVSASINTAVRQQSTGSKIANLGDESQAATSGPQSKTGKTNDSPQKQSSQPDALAPTNPSAPISSGSPAPNISPAPTASANNTPSSPASAPSTPSQPNTPSTPTCQNGHLGIYPNCVAPAPMPVGISGSWRLIMQDEFNGSNLNTGMWTPQRGPSYSYGDPYNPQSEDAYYLANNPKVAAGNLALTLTKGTTNNYPYSSGMVQNGRHFSYKYGYVESRIKVPGATGVWPAFWTLSAPVDQQWPPEIDIFEFGLQGQSRPSFNYHFGTSSNHKQTGLTLYGNSTVNYSQDFHTYGMYWSANRIQVYIDGAPGPSYTVAANITNIPQYIILNLGLSKGATVPSGTAMYIDYVRVWQ